MYRGSFWITPMIQNASGFILDHPDDSKLHRGAILNHRDDPELHRDDPELMGEDAKPGREDAVTVLDDPTMLGDDPGTARNDPELDRDDPKLDTGSNSEAQRSRRARYEKLSVLSGSLW